MHTFFEDLKIWASEVNNMQSNTDSADQSILIGLLSSECSDYFCSKFYHSVCIYLAVSNNGDNDKCSSYFWSLWYASDRAGQCMQLWIRERHSYDPDIYFRMEVLRNYRNNDTIFDYIHNAKTL